MYDALPREILAEAALFDHGHVALLYVALTAHAVVVLSVTTDALAHNP